MFLLASQCAALASATLTQLLLASAGLARAALVIASAVVFVRSVRVVLAGANHLLAQLLLASKNKRIGVLGQRKIARRCVGAGENKWMPGQASGNKCSGV